MAASRLSDSQKQELVVRYRQGETGQALAQAYGCSPNTVSRVLKAALGAEELASLKKQSRAGGRSQVSAADTVPPDLQPLGAEASSHEQAQPAATDAPVNPGGSACSVSLDPGPEHVPEADDDAGNDDVVATTLAIDDADDFGDDGLDEADDDGDEADQPLIPASSPSGAPSQVLLPRPLGPDSLPGSLYLLVDKTVELDARPLREFSELGSLPEDEQERQALMLYVNPRQAKRQCGRSQRVIKVPDSGVLQRTSRYLVAQGITRLVLEGGGVFALPSQAAQ